jgi:DNA-binding transcriptional regulator YhcF (GntR family)
VLSGALRPGTRMPSSRAMASKLGVARASVVLAYEHLLAEGYVESRHGSGKFIAGDLTGLAPAQHEKLAMREMDRARRLEQDRDPSTTNA